MKVLFYISGFCAIFATLKMVIGKNAVHALLYLIVSLISISVIFFLLDAPFVAALEVIVYAGAIMVLFVFVIMMLNVSKDGIKKERELLKPNIWIGPSIITVVLFCEMLYMLTHQVTHLMPTHNFPTGSVGILMFSKYMIVVELAAFLLAAGIIGAYHLGEKEKTIHHRYLKTEQQNT